MLCKPIERHRWNQVNAALRGAGKTADPPPVGD
jgi:hypothetical protein